MESKRLPRVLLIYRAMIPSIRLCGHMQMQALCEMGKIEYRHSSMHDLWKEDLSWPDIAVLGRMDTRAECYVAKRLKKMGKYLIYILDDDLLNVPGHVSSAAHYGTREVKRQITEIIGMSDAILSPSPLILEKYAHAHTRRMLTEEPAVNPAPFQAHDPQRAVTIGFAGSVDRILDIESVLREALEKIRAEYGNSVEFSFFGAAPAFAQNLNAKVIPYQDSYEEYRHMLDAAGWDIGLAPMVDSAFHRHKHYNKFCEYAAAGIVGVYSRCEPYIRLEKNIGIGCFCENTPQAWVEALKGLLDHPQQREQMRERACRYAHEHLTIEHIAEKLFGDYADVFSYRAPDVNRHVYLRTIMVRQTAARLLIVFQAYGWNTFGQLMRSAGKRLAGRINRRHSPVKDT